jgi:hypothetical protein
VSWFLVRGSLHQQLGHTFSPPSIKLFTNLQRYTTKICTFALAYSGSMQFVSNIFNDLPCTLQGHSSTGSKLVVSLNNSNNNLQAKEIRLSYQSFGACALQLQKQHSADKVSHTNVPSPVVRPQRLRSVVQALTSGITPVSGADATANQKVRRTSGPAWPLSRLGCWRGSAQHQVHATLLLVRNRRERRCVTWQLSGAGKTCHNSARSV